MLGQFYTFGIGTGKTQNTKSINLICRLVTARIRFDMVTNLQY